MEFQHRLEFQQWDREATSKIVVIDATVSQQPSSMPSKRYVPATQLSEETPYPSQERQLAAKLSCLFKRSVVQTLGQHSTS